MSFVVRHFRGVGIEIHMFFTPFQELREPIIGFEGFNCVESVLQFLFRKICVDCPMADVTDVDVVVGVVLQIFVLVS